MGTPSKELFSKATRHVLVWVPASLSKFGGGLLCSAGLSVAEEAKELGLFHP